MARVLIVEPDPEVCELLARVVSRRGDEAVVAARSDVGGSADVLLVEPAAAGAAGLVEAFHAANPAAAVICISGSPQRTPLPSACPTVVLPKPFDLVALDAALSAAAAR